MKPWQVSKQWADGYLAAIEASLGSIAGRLISIEQASDYQDRHEATDYVLRCEAGAVARPDWPHRDFTLRHSRPSGAKCETAKILEGWGRWYFYGWAKQSGRELAEWIVVDLDALRRTKLIEDAPVTWNHDRSSSFKAIQLVKLAQYGCLKAHEWA